MKFEDQQYVDRTFEHRFYADVSTGNANTSDVRIRYDHDDESLRFHIGSTVYLTIHQDDFEQMVSARDELLPHLAQPSHRATFIDWESGDEITAFFNSRVQADMFVQTCQVRGIPAWKVRCSENCTVPQPAETSHFANNI